MRNLKRALSLLLSSTMVLGMVVMGGSAAGYQDVDASNDNQEAIEVLQAVGIMSGVDDAGNFNPDGSLTRNEMAVVMAHLLNLDYDYYRGVNTFTDVPDWAAPYVAACVAEGVTAGIGNGLYGGDQKITAAQAGLMVMKALGYFQNQEDFGTDWQVATIRQASYINLFDKVNSNAESALTRGQVAQLVLNGLKSNMVTFTGDKGVQIGDVTVGYRAEYTPVTNAASKYNTIITGTTTIIGDNGQYYVQLGEELYDGKLKLANGSDDFERPSRVWSYDGQEIGTYAKKELMVASYTEGVTGKEMYDLLTSATIKDYELFSYVDGGKGSIKDTDLTRSNQKDLSDTGNGVLTEVYVDNTAKEITIVSVNTWLAQATADYNANSESGTLKIYSLSNSGKTTYTTQTVDVEDVPAVADLTQDKFVLVNQSIKDRNALEVVAISDVKILENSTVTKFSQSGNDQTEGFFSKLTVDGTEYKAAYQAAYDDEVLNLYDATLLTDMSYNVYLDQYGYAIGVDLYEGEANYVFITGYDRSASYISIKTADAAAIFTDGNMDTITVNVTDTNKNIDKLNNVTDDNIGDGAYYNMWVSGGDLDLNRWYSYTVDSNNVYTLKPVEGRMFVTDFDNTLPETINCANVRLTDDVLGVNGRAYGNDDSTYITVEAGSVDMSAAGKDDAIVDVTGVYTGVQDVDIDITADVKADVAEGSVYTLKDRDDYIIASIVLGEAKGSTANYAFILSDAKSEGIEDGYYYWEFEAVMGGEKVTLTARSKYASTINDLKVGTVQELRFDGDYVVSVDDISSSKFITNYATSWNDHEVYDVKYNGETLNLEGRTLQSSGRGDQGLTIISTSMPTVLRQVVNNETKTENYASLEQAIGALADANKTTDGLQFKGRIVAVLNAQGVAEWVYMVSDTPVTTGSGITGGDGDYYSFTANVYSTGYATMSYTVNRPEWLATNDTGSDALKFSFNVMVNGKPYTTVSGNVPNGQTSMSSSWDNASGGIPLMLINPIPENATVTIDNFKFDLSDQTYNVQWVSPNGEKLPTGSINGGSSTGTIQADVPAVLNCRVASTIYGSGTFNWSVEGVEPAVAGNGAVLSGTGVTAPNTVTTSQNVKVKDNWEGYVSFVIDTTNLANKYTVTGSAAKTLNTWVSSYNGYFASTNVALYVAADGGSQTTVTRTVADGTNVDIRVALTGGAIANTVGYGLKVTLSTGDSVIFPNDGSTTVQKVDLDNVRANQTVTITKVEQIAAPTVDFGNCVWTDVNNNGVVDKGDTIKVAFTKPVTVVTKPTGGNLTNIMSAATDNVSNGDTNVSSITYTITDAGNTDGTIAFAAGNFKDATTGIQNTAVTVKVTVSNGNIAK